MYNVQEKFYTTAKKYNTKNIVYYIDNVVI